MKTLLVMRHAKSSWKDSSLDDHERPLNKRGKRDAPRMGRLIRELGVAFDHVVCSTAVRARKTAAKVLESSGCDAVIELNPELYGAQPQNCVDMLNDLYYDDPCVLLVGHNPCLENLLAALTQKTNALPTAALAQVTLPILSWRSLTLRTKGELAGLWLPRELD